MQYILHAPKSLHGKILLPASKSISNRALILNALANKDNPDKELQVIENLADCDDTNVLVEALRFKTNRIDIKAAGTAMRFMTAFLATQEGTWEITGSQRMKNRPIRVLTEALNRLGAEIKYIEKEGFPPLRILGKKIMGGEIDIEGNISSQYLSALLMLGPTMQKGLCLHIQGKLISKPYLRMTLEMMQEFGVKAEYLNQSITIEPQQYQIRFFKVESDWSGASYWYQMLCLAQDGAIELEGLYPDSLQGDARVASWFEELGVHTEYMEWGIRLTKVAQASQTFTADFTDQPDLAQTFAVACALKGIPFRLSGLQSLKIKETDRIQALINESRKIGFLLTEKDGNILEWNGEQVDCIPEPSIETYEDHRMAMAFAPAAFKIKNLRINHPDVVSKSYPTFWSDLKSSGFIIDSEA